MEAAARHVDAGVIGITLGGEERFPPEPYAEIFSAARESGLRSVPHAGETHGPDSIRGALEALGADRIGHGIRVLEDPSLVALLIEREVALDVCPTSNLRTRSVPSLAEHPLPAMLDAGLACTLASDDPSMFGSALSYEYEVCRSIFGFDDEAIAALALAGVRASFADPDTKAGLEGAIGAWLSDQGDRTSVSG
jgi:adenosine deaminase